MNCIKDLEIHLLRQMANLKNVLCHKLKTINRELFKPYDYLRESKMQPSLRILV